MPLFRGRLAELTVNKLLTLLFHLQFFYPAFAANSPESRLIDFNGPARSRHINSSKALVRTLHSTFGNLEKQPEPNSG